jgi:hypothetical protein
MAKKDKNMSEAVEAVEAVEETESIESGKKYAVRLGERVWQTARGFKNSAKGINITEKDGYIHLKLILPDGEALEKMALNQAKILVAETLGNMSKEQLLASKPNNPLEIDLTTEEFLRKLFPSRYERERGPISRDSDVELVNAHLLRVKGDSPVTFLGNQPTSYSAVKAFKAANPEAFETMLNKIVEAMKGLDF